MAFGKDRSTIGNMNLRQQMRRGTKRPPRSGGGGKGGAYWRNKFLPADTGPADLIRVIPGQYPTPRVDFDAKDYVYDADGKIVVDLLPYWKYISYFHGVKEVSVIGSEGPLGDFKGKGEPCVANEWYWWEWRQRKADKEAGGSGKKPNSLRRSEQFAFTVLNMAPFYKVPVIDKKTNQVRVNENTKEPYYDWKKGSKRGNDEFAAAGYERKEGHLQHWSMGFSHWNTLTEYADNLARNCRSCQAHGSIVEVALLCQACGEAIVEFDSTSLDDEDLQKLRVEEVMCSHCRYTGYLEDMIRCENCAHGEQSTLFDYDLEVKRVKTSANDGGQQTTLQILNAYGPRPIDPMYGEELRKPLDLPKIFTPTPLDQQIQLLGPVPSDDAPQGQDSNPRQPSNRNTRSYG